jgi:hypothetical protein
MNGDLFQRIRRIYAAVQTAEESDPNGLMAKVISTKNLIGVCQDFSGGRSPAELSNIAHSMIHIIANFGNHLKRLACRNERDKKKIDEMIKESMELRIIMDLSNNEKHGYPPRNGGDSGRCPQLVKINCVMRLKTRGQKGSKSGMVQGPNGIPKFFGDGTTKAVVTGEVVDKDNNPIGDLYDIATKAMEVWEKILNKFDVTY